MDPVLRAMVARLNACGHLESDFEVEVPVSEEVGMIRSASPRAPKELEEMIDARNKNRVPNC